MGSVNKVWVPVVPNTRKFRAETLAFLKELEKSLELAIKLALDDQGLGASMRAEREQLQRESNRNPVTVPVQGGDLDRSFRQRIRQDVQKAVRGIEAEIPATADGERLRSQLSARVQELERQLQVEIPTEPVAAANYRQRVQQLRDQITGMRPAQVPIEPEPAESVIDQQWRARLRRQLDQATQGIEANIPAGIDGERMREQLRRDFEAAREQLDARIPVGAEESARFRHEVDRLVDKIQSQHAAINADADTGLAEAQLKIAARRRRVEIIATVSKKSLASVGSFLAATSGLRVVSDTFEGIGNRLKNLDRAVPKIAGLSLAIGSLGSVVLSSVAGITTLGSSLAYLAALAAPLPGFLLAGAAAVGVLVAALKDTKTQLASLGPMFTRLQDGLSARFWDRAKQPIVDLVKSVFPSLQAGLNNVAESLGDWAGSVAGSFQKAFSPDVISTITGQLAKGIRESIRGTDAFAASIAGLGVFSAQYLPGVGRVFSDLAIKFNDWVQTVVSNGQLAGWVQDGIAVFKQLVGIVGGVLGILGDVARAAAAVGSNGLNSLATGLEEINKVTDSPAFQGALQEIFRGAGKGAEALAKGLGGVGRLLEGMSGSIEVALQVLGGAAGELIGGIADALNQPEVGQGLQDAVHGIADGIHDLIPSLPELGKLFGAMLTLVGKLAKTLGPVLGEALKQASPLLTELVKSISPFVEDMGPVLVNLIKELAPLFEEAAKQAGPLGEKVFPVIVEAVKELAPVLKDLMPKIADLLPPLVDVAGEMLDGLGQALPVLIPLLGLFARMLQPLVGILDFVAGGIKALAKVTQGDFPGALQAITDGLQGFMDQMNGSAQAWVDIFTGIFSKILPPIAAVFDQAGQGLMLFIGDVISGMTNVATSVQNGFNLMVGFTQTGIALFGQAVQQGVNAVGQFVVGIATNLAAGAAQVLGFFRQVAGAVASVWNSAWNSARQIAGVAIAGVQAVVGAGVSFVLSAVRGVQVVGSIFQSAFGVLGGIVSNAIGAVRGVLGSIPGMVRGAVGNLGGILVGAGRSIIDGLMSGIRSALGALRSLLGSVTSMIPEWKGPPDTDAKLLRPNGRLIMGGLIDGIGDRTRDLKRTLQDVTATIPQYAPSASLAADVSTGSAFAWPESMTLVDQDGSILARTKVIADGAVAEGNTARSNQLGAGLNRRYA